MPLVKIELLKGKSAEYKKTLLESVHAGLVESLGIEDWDRFQRIIEYDKADFEFPDFKSDNFMIIGLTIFPGRTAEQKQSAITLIKNKLNSNLKIEPKDVFIVIIDPPRENWSI
jgi:phenylpyruvate tautomerase PptA (4-oxalocrotonate tautomerase family)